MGGPGPRRCRRGRDSACHVHAEYAPARQLLSLGLKPVALIGHSVGEFAAAVLAGVMRPGAALRSGAHAGAGALMQALPPGVMLSVRLRAPDLEARLTPGISLAAENKSRLGCVAAGP